MFGLKIEFHREEWGWKLVSRREWNDVQKRLKDLERHFVTKRNEKGEIVETLADVPVSERKKLAGGKLAGMSWPQRRQWLEKTDGGRNIQ